MVISKSTGEFQSLTDVQAAYLAGLIDGEGCIHTRYSPPAAKLNRYIQYELRIAMSDLLTLQYLQTLTGVGTIYVQTAAQRRKWTKKNTTKDFYSWICRRNSGAIEILTRVLPYLHTKREQAELFLQLAPLVRTRKERLLHGADWSTQIALVNKITDLKQWRTA